MHKIYPTHKGFAPIPLTKGGHGVVLWVIIAAVLLGGGYAAYRNYQQPTTDNRQRAETSMDTKDWKTYRNKKYGFEFRYPSIWEYFEDSFDGGDTYSFHIPKPSYVQVLDIGVEQVVSVSKMTCEGKKIGAIRIGGTLVDKCFDEQPENRWVARISGSNNYVFYCWYDNSDCERVLATFRFTPLEN